MIFVRKLNMQTEWNERNHAWRRWQQQRPSHQGIAPAHRKQTENWCLEKDWSMMYFRKEKLRRAKQLRLIYPVRQQQFAEEWFD